MKAIYCILNKLNGKRYIGSTNNFYSRIRGHKSSLKQGKHKNIHLQRAWDLYGSEHFEFLILEKVEDSKDLIPKEQWWIDNTPCQYNICKVVVSTTLGVKKRPETIEKLRQANLGVKHPDWRNEIKSKAQGGTNHWQYGKKMTPEVVKKKSETMKKKYAEGYIHPKCKEIEKIEPSTGEILESFSSVQKAADGNHNKATAISNCLTGKTKISYGYKWRYKTT